MLWICIVGPLLLVLIQTGNFEKQCCCRGPVLLLVSLPHCPCASGARSWRQVDAHAVIQYTRHVNTFKTVSAFIPSTLKTCFHPLHQFIAQIVPSFIDSIILMLVYRLIEKRLIFQGPHNTKHLSPAFQLLNSSLLLLCIVCSAAPASDSPSFIIRSHQIMLFARPHTNTHEHTHMLAHACSSRICHLYTILFQPFNGSL